MQQNSLLILFWFHSSLFFSGCVHAAGKDKQELRKSKNLLDEVQHMEVVHELHKNQQQEKSESHVIDIEKKNKAIFVPNILNIDRLELDQFCATQRDNLLSSGAASQKEIASLELELVGLSALYKLNKKIETIQGKQKSWCPDIKQAAHTTVLVFVVLVAPFVFKYLNLLLSI